MTPLYKAAQRLSAIVSPVGFIVPTDPHEARDWCDTVADAYRAADGPSLLDQPPTPGVVPIWFEHACVRRAALALGGAYRVTLRTDVAWEEQARLIGRAQGLVEAALHAHREYDPSTSSEVLRMVRLLSDAARRRLGSY